MLVMEKTGFVKRHRAWKFGAVILAAALSGCGAPHLSLPRHPVILPRPTLTIISPSGSPAGFNPVTTRRQMPGHLLDQLMWNALVTVAPNGALAPDLASKWVLSHQNRRVVITLDPRAKWWNGRPVTAYDVMWSYRFYLRQSSGFPRAKLLAHVLKSVKAINATQVSFSLREPDPGFLGTFASQANGPYILPSFLLHGLAVSKVASSRILANPVDFVGTGPFRPVAAGGFQVTLKAVPRYFEGAPHIADIVWASLPPAHFSPQMAALWLSSPPKPVSGLVQEWRPDNRVWTLLPNFNRISHKVASALISALYRSLDRKRLALVAHGVPANGPVLPSNWAYYPGLKPATSNGSTTVPGLGGKSWVISVNQSHPRLVAACQLITQETGAVGLHFSCHGLSSSAYRHTVTTGQFQWALDDTDASPLGWFYSRSRGGMIPPWGTNIGAYNDSAVNRALDRAATATSISQHLAGLYQAETELQQNPPGVFLVWPETPWWHTANVVGIEPNPYVKFYQAQTWQIRPVLRGKK